MISTLLMLTVFMQDAAEGPRIVDRVAIKVNDKIITEREVMLTYQQQKASLIQEYAGPDLQSKLEALWGRVVSRAEEQLLLYEKAVELGLDVSEDAMDSRIQSIKESNGFSDDEFESVLMQQTGMTLSEYVDSQRRDESAQRVIHSEVVNAIKIDDSQVAQYYEEHLDDFKEPAKYRIAEIVVLKEENPSSAKIKALACRDSIESGTAFADAAMQYSDSASKDNGGDLGEVQYGDLHYAIEEAVQGLEIGAISEVLETDTAYFIVKVLNKREARPKPIDDVEDEIEQKLREPRLENALDKFITDLKQEYLVERVVTEPSRY